MSDEPIYIVYCNAMHRGEDLARIRDRCAEVLGERVLVVDARIDRIEQLGEAERSRLVHVLASSLGLEE